MKKWGIRIFGLIMILLIAAVAYIEFNKEALVQAAVDEANTSIDGTILYQDADVSLFRSFPDLRITLENMSITSEAGQKSSQLMSVGSLSLDVDLMTALKSSQTIKVNGIDIDDAMIHLVAFKDGSNNYSILPESNEESSSAMDFDINNFSISNSTLSYKDVKAGQTTELGDIDIEGKAKYKSSEIIVESKMNGYIGLDYGHILPKYKATLSANTALRVNAAADTIEVNTADLTLNDLPINIGGYISLSSDDTGYNFKFDSPATSIKKLISLLPTYYKNEYGSIITSGTYALNGKVNGTSNNKYPLYKIQLNAKDGSISYPGLANKIDRLSFDMKAENKSNKTLYESIIIQDLDIKSGKSFLNGDVDVRNGVASKTVFNIEGDINLSDLKESLVLSETSELSGLIKGKISGGASISNDNSARVSDQAFESDVTLSNINYINGESSIFISHGSIDGDKDALSYKLESLQYGKAINAKIHGTINQPLSAALDSNHVVTGETNIVAETIDLNALSGETDTTIVASAFSIPKANIKYNLEATKILYGDYILNSIEASGNLDNKLSKSVFSIEEFKGSKLEGTADLKNILSYVLNSDTLEGSVNIKSDRLALDRFMSAEDTSLVVENTDLIPANINLDIDYSSDEIKFRNIDIAKALGQVSLKEKKVIFKNEGNIFGGKILFTGTFDTDRPEGFNIDLDLQLDQLQFGETASNLALFSKLIPIAKFIEGEYSGNLKWQSDLSSSYIPDLNSLTAYGEIETEDGKISSLLPIDTFIRKIVQVDKGHELQLSNTKKYFVVEEGKVVVKGIELEKQGIQMFMSGSHGFNQDLDYQVVIDIPKNKLKADQLIGFVQDKFKFSDKLKSSVDDVMVQVVLYMGGSITKPTFSVQKINLKRGSVVENIQDQVVATLEDTRDSIQTVIEDTISATRDMVQEKIDSTKDAILNKIDSTKEVITNMVDSNIVSLEDLVSTETDKIKEQGGAIIDSIKAGNVDSLMTKIEDLFGEKKNMIDSLKKKPPVDISILKKIIKNGGS